MASVPAPYLLRSDGGGRVGLLAPTLSHCGQPPGTRRGRRLRRRDTRGLSRKKWHDWPRPSGRPCARGTTTALRHARMRDVEKPRAGGRKWRARGLGFITAWPGRWDGCMRAIGRIAWTSMRPDGGGPARCSRGLDQGRFGHVHYLEPPASASLLTAAEAMQPPAINKQPSHLSIRCLSRTLFAHAGVLSCLGGRQT